MAQMRQVRARRERRNLAAVAEYHTDSARCYMHSAAEYHMDSARRMGPAVERHNHPALHMEQVLEARRDWREAHMAARPGQKMMAPRIALVE